MHDGTVGIVILAAGESTRMGQPKQLLAYGGSTLLRHAAETALEMPGSPVFVVLGAYADRLQPILADLDLSVVYNADWHDGMGTSLRSGLRALIAAHPAAAAALFMLCDQPYVSSALLDHMIQSWRNGARMAASQYESRLGVPAIFDSALFAELLTLEGAAGARQVLAKYVPEVDIIPFASGGLDIDTPADYARLLNADPTSAQRTD